MTDYLKHIIPEFLLQYFPADKILHFSVSFLLLIFIFLTRKYLLKEEGFLRIFAFSFRDVIIVGILKEIIDSFGFGNAEFMDIVADLSGIIIPIYLFFIFKLSGKLKKSEKLKFEIELIIKYKLQKNISSKMKVLIILTIIWFLNIFYLILKIPILSLNETYLFLIKILKKNLD